MSQKVIIAILAGIIILGGGAWYYQNSGAGAERAAGEREGGAKERDGSVMDTIKDGAGGLADVFGGGDAAECRFSGKDPETGEYSEGVVYVDGESFRMEADTVVDGQEVRMYIIQHEHVMYMWSDGEAEGIMMDMSAFADMEGAEKPESPIDWLKDPESGADYDCKGWSANARSFEPPEDISFIDMFGGLGEAFGEMFEQGMADPSMWGGGAEAGY